MTTATKVTLRWMIRRDVPDVVRFEADSPGGWDEAKILAFLKPSSNISFVAEAGGRVVAVCFYQLRADGIRLHRVAVDPGFRLRGVGRALVARLQRTLQPGHRRRTIRAAVGEYALGSQLFLKKCGFTGSLREGKLRFVYRLKD